MSLDVQYNFLEAKLDASFAKEQLNNFKGLINRSLSFVVLSMPGVGVSYFLRYLAMQDFASFIHIDLYELPTLSQHEFYKLLFTELGGRLGSKTDDQLLQESKKLLKDFAQNREKIVLIFSRFDQLHKAFDWNFLSNIQSLTTVSPGKISLIFTSTKPLSDLAPDALTGGNLNFYSENLYFKPYSKDDLKKLYDIEPARATPKALLDHLIELSGGHNQLLHILLSSQKQQNLLLDNFVKMQMKELVDFLDYHQRKALQRIALRQAQGKLLEIDEYLLGVGMVKKVQSSKFKVQIFTPLLSEYVRKYQPVKLPVKESKLFKLLRENIGKTVTKDEIFAKVWEENPEEATDWALDALVYRLRKHPFMHANGYIIESQKKVGYTLIQT